jgi:hypothetical protein
MAFERAPIHINSASVGTGLKVTVKKRSAPATITFTLTKALASQFSWSDGDKLELFVGTEGDHGIIRFRKNNSIGDAPVSFKKSGKGDWVSISIGHQPRFVDEAQPASWVKHEQIDGGFVEIVLPRWADRTAPAKFKAVSPAQQPIIRPNAPVGQRASVTGSLMGDPLPNRREVMAKIGDVKA